MPLLLLKPADSHSTSTAGVGFQETSCPPSSMIASLKGVLQVIFTMPLKSEPKRTPNKKIEAIASIFE